MLNTPRPYNPNPHSSGGCGNSLVNAPCAYAVCGVYGGQGIPEPGNPFCPPMKRNNSNPFPDCPILVNAEAEAQFPPEYNP